MMQDRTERPYITKRLLSFFSDYLLYYVINFLFVFIIYINTMPIEEKQNLQSYKSEFDTIMHTRTFILCYVALLLIVEGIIPLFMNGQSITKKMFRLQIVHSNKIQIFIRSLLKIITVNPFGCVSYFVGLCINPFFGNISSIVLSIFFWVNIVMLVIGKDSLHDKIAHTLLISE